MTITISVPSIDVPIIDEVDVLVIGGGIAGVASAVCAARFGTKTMLVERYAYLGGLVTGAMVLQMNDMCDDNEVVIAGLANELIDRLDSLGGVVKPAADDLFKSSPALYDKYKWWGALEKYGEAYPDKVLYRPIVDVECTKYALQQLVEEAKVKVRYHSIFTNAITEGDTITGAVFYSKAGYYAVKAKIVIDATGDGDVFTGAGAEYARGNFIITSSHFMGNVDTEAMQLYSKEDPEQFKEINKQVREIYGVSWLEWMAFTVNPGVVWCDCPHFTKKDGLSIEDLTEVEFEGRRRIWKALNFLRRNMPGFENAYIAKVGDQTGVRQTRLLVGEYVMTSIDIKNKVRFKDSVGRGGKYTYPYRSLVPIKLDGLLAVGRHFSVKPSAQVQAREWPPCLVTGQAAGTAAALALSRGVRLRDVDISELQQKLLDQGVIL